MRGLFSQFDDSLVIAVSVVVVTLVAAAGIGFRTRQSGRSWRVPVARVLTVGSVAVAVVATALPRSGFRIERDGDLVMTPGRGGLGDLGQVAADPTSLAAVLLFANVLLYVPTAFMATLGWLHRHRRVLPGCLLLSIVVETGQYTVLGRVATVDDVILNTAGAVTGYVAALAVARVAHLGAVDE